MRISDWSSDVCSSDLGKAAGEGVAVEHADIAREPCRPGAVVALVVEPAGLLAAFQIGEEACAVLFQRNRSVDVTLRHRHALRELRSEERRVGKECVRTGRSRWSPSQ